MVHKQTKSLAQRNNIIRASVMGANDGILSVSGIVIGVAGATTNTFSILIAGFAGALAGTVSMAMGEYVSVHAQNDAQKRAEKEQQNRLESSFQQEQTWLENKYVKSGIPSDLARQAVSEMMIVDPLGTTIRERYGFTLHEEMNAMSASVASMISFPLGSILPMLAISTMPHEHAINVMVTALSVIIALAFTGYSSAKLSGANLYRATLRNVLAGIFTMLVTYAIGLMMGR
ncbi:VIT family protein [Weissella diestrammenae]|uniref:VIT family protein n=1 Tax=Weissella diestrammenae TaxID=1162633 RepID=A0A7G9T5V5_9LACO|nr:VIT family protein [Weissella diestrammenae]MCM0582310.1 VIT family protein [Weissella diestrammenae]QNN75480.1 VIT family protein [Weissella diestrammenae]